ncbi:MAG TPA: hypothetical protein VF157_12165 [Chloroflexota bacterium]
MAATRQHMSRAHLWLFILALGLLPGPATALAQSPRPCSFGGGFQALHDAATFDIGECRGDQVYANNGDASQATSRGLLVWRKADNWTGFIGASRTLVVTPSGLAQRPNADRFDWELGGATADEGLFGDPASALLPPDALGPGFGTVDSSESEVMASATLLRPGFDHLRPARSVVQTVQILPTPELAHGLFLDLANLEHGDLTLKTTQLGDESQVLAWKPDDTTTYGATFRQLAVRARKSNALVTIVLLPGTRLEYAVQLASMAFGLLR